MGDADNGSRWTARRLVYLLLISVAAVFVIFQLYATIGVAIWLSAD